MHIIMDTPTHFSAQISCDIIKGNFVMSAECHFRHLSDMKYMFAARDLSCF